MPADPYFPEFNWLTIEDAENSFSVVLCPKLASASYILLVTGFLMFFESIPFSSDASLICLSSSVDASVSFTDPG